ncbi:MAG TPA: cytochrome c peroxidase, partial [Steroidobacteraceae bacterium]
MGKKIFFDLSLSSSGKLACASCHDPAHAYGPPNGLAVQPGGESMNRQGLRAVPSLRYVLNRTPVWSQNAVSSAAERLIEGDEPPTGGFGWDGRFNSLHEQALFPLFAENEMAAGSPATLTAKLRKAAYARQFTDLFGRNVFDDPNRTVAMAASALERFELTDTSFHPYDSKFDDYLNGKVQFSEKEQRGMALFDDPKRGNCAKCHLDRKGADGSHPLFTDYQFQVLGVPRNSEIRVNADAGYFDQGLCGPIRADQAGKSKYCGMFKTPTLRNVATRSVFFHNGQFHTLQASLDFYVRRDTDPQRWYPARVSGGVEKFVDLPEKFRVNVDVTEE